MVILANSILPEHQQQYDFIQPDVTGYDEYGKPVIGNLVPTTFISSNQPANPAEYQFLPDAYRTEDVRKFYSELDIVISEDDEKIPAIILDNENEIVYQVIDSRIFGKGRHCRVFAVRLTRAEAEKRYTSAPFSGWAP